MGAWATPPDDPGLTTHPSVPPYLRVRIALVRLDPMKRLGTVLPGFTPAVRILLDPP